MHNWADSYTFAAAEVVRPTSVDAVRAAVTSAARVHAVGSTHSFHDIADSSGTLISLADMPAAVEIDSARGVVRVPAGLRYGDLAPQLHAAGFALRNLASLPHISVAGSVATGTHGSGDAVRPLSSDVAAVELVTATGDVERIARGDRRFPGAVVSLGALGIVTTLELDIVPAFDVAQTVFDSIPLDAYLEHLDEITALGYSVSGFTRFDPQVIDTLWVKALGDAPAPSEVLGVAARTTQRHMLPDQDAAATTPQLGAPGPWFERLPHFKLEFTPSAGAEVQSEYLLPRSRAVEAIRALHGIADGFRDVLMISEIRTMAADDLWLSGARGRDTVGLHFTWHRRVPEVLAALVPIEEVLLPLGARAHWGKLFATADPFAQHPDAAAFGSLVAELDPAGRFRGPFLDRYLR